MPETTVDKLEMDLAETRLAIDEMQRREFALLMELAASRERQMVVKYIDHIAGLVAEAQKYEEWARYKAALEAHRKLRLVNKDAAQLDMRFVRPVIRRLVDRIATDLLGLPASPDPHHWDEPWGEAPEERR